MAAFKANTGEELWNINLSAWSSYAPAISNGVLFLGSKEYQLCALNGTNGKIVWNSSIGSQPTMISPVIASDILYLSYFGELCAYNATNGSQLWSYNMTAYYGTRSMSGPVVDNGTIYVASGNSVYAFVDESILPESSTPQTDESPTNSRSLIIEASIAIVAILVVVFGIWRYKKKLKGTTVMEPDRNPTQSP